MDNKTRLWRLKELKFLLDNWDGFFSKAGVQFNVNTWFTKGSVIGGTYACALGAACLYPPFKKLGLRLIKGKYCRYPAYGNGCFQSVGEKFFGITYSDAFSLFSRQSFPSSIEVTSTIVSKRLGKIIKKYNRK